MELIRPYFSFKKPFVKSKSIALQDGLLIHKLLVRSRRLKRNVKVDIYMPMPFNPGSRPYPALLLNDGQDAGQLNLAKSLRRHHQLSDKLVIVAVHAGDRINEYGTAGVPDYQHRGWKAKTYEDFIVHKLLPYLRKHYQLFLEQKLSYTAGFSLGGLSAIDMLWRYPEVFSKTGVFSGSFWWRHQPPTDYDPDGHRIMHEIVQKGSFKDGVKFWFQTGTRDEECDRNNNGVIDAIDDTLDLIDELKQKGYQNKDIQYVEIEGGEHNFDTWSKIFPDFLSWLYTEIIVEKEKPARLIS